MADAPFSFLPLGATIQTFKVNGINIVQGFENAEQQLAHNGPYFGETIGRIANRTSGARIQSLNGGKSYALAANDRGNNLHGGLDGWGKRTWKGPEPVGTRAIPGVDNLEGGESVAFTLISDDGDQGFPGTVEARVVYTTGTQRGAENGKDVTVLGIEYEAKVLDSSPADETAVNMTNHSYFNLAGCPHAQTYDGTTVTLATNQHLPIDDTSIPTGGPVPFPAFDTSKPFTLTATGPDVDHCFTLAEDPSSVPLDTRSQPLRRNLAAHHPSTGIHLEVLSTEPSFQFYTGKHIDVPAVGNLPARGSNSAFCCEPSRWVNAVNTPEWKNQVLLKKGQTYGARIVYRGWSE
ncbi:Bifunctional protein-like protein [Hapsidospora chrysogenum ATCC 11550]|uniref:Bifunctional protein-like protein n=1 Tax=Hapsidospora chrysogenum (strain ATCC 11550 / CBS 779.69 / DSM 880 / IAM 14645 / JCM 23072 / IMI 49137) TaxID=857340 RepID=A0A086TFZ7_HAPC1|nr:Bifunctional protein-like protein [Hapsidospora chrysogenum ATCC 11550]